MSLLLEFQLDELLDNFNQLNEDISWDAGKPLDSQLQQAASRFAAASRALGIANKLKNPESRAKHKSRVMSMLNVLRASLHRLELAIQGEMDAMNSQ